MGRGNSAGFRLQLVFGVSCRGEEGGRREKGGDASEWRNSQGS